MDSMSELAIATGDALEQELQGGIDVLQANLAELENSIYHLVRSNVELAQFLDESPGDADLEQALEENKEVLERKRKRFKSLKRVIAELKANRPHLNDSPALAPESSTSTSTSTSRGNGVSGISMPATGRIGRDGTITNDRVHENLPGVNINSNINSSNASGGGIGTGDADTSRMALALGAGESGYDRGSSMREGGDGLIL